MSPTQAALEWATLAENGLTMVRAFGIMFVLLATGASWAQNHFVGDAACQSCHAAQVESFHQTAHFLTSSSPDAHSILGSFASGDNTLKTSNPNLYFEMENKQGGFFQTAVAGTPPHTHPRSEQFGLVVGSGDKGQTYLFWDDDQLFQLPISWWKTVGWVNSPGYRDGFADFERPIIPRCLECHATRFASQAPPTNRYAITGYALGIQCEKCHGAGGRHVAIEQAKPGPGTPTGILNPAHFARERQMDLCAWCHAGQGQTVKPSFTYPPGEPLDQYIHLAKADPSAPPEVHGNQVELLKQSRCYLASAMTCISCHNVHAPEHDLAAFSLRCLGCHKADSATFAKAGHPLVANCIDCHMPKQETNLIVFHSGGEQMRPQVRSHWIKVYASGQP